MEKKPIYLDEFLEWYARTDDDGRKILDQALADLLNNYSEEFEEVTDE